MPHPRPQEHRRQQRTSVCSNWRGARGASCSSGRCWCNWSCCFSGCTASSGSWSTSRSWCADVGAGGTEEGVRSMLNFNTKSICLSLSQKLKLNKYNPKTTLHSPTTTTTTTTRTTTQEWRVSAHLLVLAFATNLIVRSSCLVSLSLSILIAIVLALGLDLLASSARLQLCFQHACILQGFNSFVHCFTFH